MKAKIRLFIAKVLAAAFSALLLLGTVHSFVFSVSSIYSVKSKSNTTLKTYSSKESISQIVQLCLEENDSSSEDECNCAALNVLSPYTLIDWETIKVSGNKLHLNYTDRLFFSQKAPIWLVTRSIRI